MPNRRLLSWLVTLFLALPAAGQNPTGSLSGRITSETGSALPGATVTVSSSALQGTRTTSSTASGGYLFRFLPPGDYEVSFEMAGFAGLQRSQKISAAQVSQLDVTLTVEEVREEIVITGNYETLATTPQASTTYEKELIESLPVNRDLRGAVTLTPGVSTTGPGDNVVISGSMSFENLFLVNGVVVNENLRGQPFDLFIEDAIQETTTATSGISAEYGRFGGGVVNAITKSGGNQFEGSLRVNFDNEDWESATPLTVDQTDQVNETYEATLGGYLWKDRAWFFLAGRDFEISETDQTALTFQPYSNNDTERRYEGKLTLGLSEGHRLIGTYMKIDETDGGVIFGTVLDTASVYDRELPQELRAVNYTGVLTGSFFVEGQYSEREFTFVGSGAPSTDRILGTLFVDRQTNNRWHSPTFCGVCEDEQRNNENYLVKGSWFVSTEGLGSHDLVFGYDSFDDIRVSDNHQSGSDFRILISRTIIGSDGVSLFPVFESGTSGSAAIIQYNPIAVSSKGTSFKTNSLFVNDSWRLSDRFTFNLGLRYDENDGVDAEGKTVVDDAKLSPRISASWDPKGDADWIVNAAYAEYVTAIANNQGDSSSRAGAPGTITWWYQGPAVNTGGGTLVDADTALGILWGWFDSTGNVNNPNVRTISIPGGTVAINETLASPSTLELALGFTKRLGTRGLARVDWVHRDGRDFYANHRDLSTGQVTLPNGSLADLSLVENEDDLLERTYDGLHTSFRYRFTDKLDLGGNYTLSKLQGNVDGETRASGPVRSDILNYPEYFDREWSFPEGDLAADQRHRLRLWASYDLVDTDHHHLSVSLLQGYASGQAYSASGLIDTRAFVTNPGYRTPPSSVTYFFSERGAFRTPDVYTTDLAINYSVQVPFFGRDLEIFFQPEVLNVFNGQAVATTNDQFFDTSVITASNTAADSCNGVRCVAFNPFTTVPVEGVHWAKGPNFGEASRPEGYQTPRTVRFSVGVRF